ncbi:transglycosylase SLT domain-containing protein [Aminobacter sp. HY435]|uniref:transglycosylase SLT domain-containing protein n=1 Tax=Aminobacter sp. HY435 TaxID=2970917 RepID=UPI0022B957EE|nr:transglycosylase SLT domain-containing protein [Aminobacter sp. HY435]
MRSSNFIKMLPIAVVLAVAGCATPPEDINNLCAVFQQRDGWIESWHTDAKRAEQKYGVPVHVLMATLRKESGFKSNARPPRTKLLGFIPWKRPSTAYGYSQALDGTWTQYQRETGNWSARRTSFASAIDFVGWYHSKTAQTYGVARDDAYSLYLAYYFGWSGYGRGDWKNNSSMQRYARSTVSMAQSYETQMRQCRL